MSLPVLELTQPIHCTALSLSSLPASVSLPVLEPDIDVVTYIERLLNTIDRLRRERDSLRCDVEFLESESRFTIEALEAKLSASIASASDKTVSTIGQQDVQEELNNAEGRYTTPQFHQLSNMTNSEDTQNLLEQIEELENRVMRRTEQIGIHQHDIKRLETNLRLQEERLAEMSTELKIMAAQKDAMVEDCAYAREARDEALIRVERLEEELESSDSRNVERMETNLRLQEERLAEMTTELKMMVAQKDAMVEDCAVAREARDEALIRVERLEKELESSGSQNVKGMETNRLQEERLAEMTNELKMMVAQKDTMVEDCAAAREARDEALIRVERLEKELESSDSRNVERLETNLRLQEERLAEMTTELKMMVAQKDAVVEDCAVAREARDEALVRVEQLEKELEGSDSHVERLERNLRLQEERLAEMTTELKMVVAQKDAVVEDCAVAREARDEALIRVGQLEKELESSDSQNVERLEANLRLQEERLAEMTAELKMMVAQKDAMVEDCAAAREARDEALIRVERLEEELESSDSRHVELMETNLRLQEERLAEMTTELKMMAAQKDAMVEDCAAAREARDEALIRVEQLEEELESLDSQIVKGMETNRLQEERLAEMTTELKMMAAQKDSMVEDCAAAREARDEALIRVERLETLERNIQSVEDEKLTMRQQMTELEAEVQRSKSLIHYLEIQIKDR